MNILELSEQEIVRRQSLQTLREMGIDPYPAAEFPTNAFSTDIKAEFKHGILTLVVPKKEAKPAVETNKYIAIEG